MSSGKQRRAEIKKRRATREAKAADKRPPKPLPTGTAPVNEALLAPNNSYGAPQFVYRGYYLDLPFICQGCGKEEVWTATQQKWWYEVAKGFAYSTAKLCRACRGEARARSDESRRLHLEGLARKKNKTV
ncbi:MAG TPA: zinc-ribbon domain containing protein [Burkholderiales bacterium]|jgi:hypothetical protein|nr:zinc-ribbon domain containing protein [Burkholderiales bacterium]